MRVAGEADLMHSESGEVGIGKYFEEVASKEEKINEFMAQGDCWLVFKTVACSYCMDAAAEGVNNTILEANNGSVIEASILFQEILANEKDLDRAWYSGASAHAYFHMLAEIEATAMLEERDDQEASDKPKQLQPLRVTAVSGDACAIVRWEPPSDVTSLPITLYQVITTVARSAVDGENVPDQANPDPNPKFPNPNPD